MPELAAKKPNIEANIRHTLIAVNNVLFILLFLSQCAGMSSPIIPTL